MESTPRVWDSTKTNWLIKSKGMRRRDAWELFKKEFPDTSISELAFYNQRSRVGASDKSKTKSSHNRQPRPLYSEQIKNNRVRIKVAQPNVWWPKSRWVYMETHPWEDFSERYNYIFLDGDLRNFDPDNIDRLPINLMGIFNRTGGVIKGHPELTRLNMAKAKLHKAILDAGEKTGEVVVYINNGRPNRRFRSSIVEGVKRYNSRHEEEVRQKRKEQWYANHEENLAKKKAYYDAHRDELRKKAREYQRKKRGMNNES